MKKLPVLIVDDEPPSREGISVMLEHDDEVEIVGTCADGRSAVEQIRSKRPALVFLDVQMPGLGGLEVLASLAPEERPAVVFVTAHDRYALRAFDLCAVDYLLKPFTDARFKDALDRAKDRIRSVRWHDRQRRLEELLDHMDGPAARTEMIGAPARVGFRVGGTYHFVAENDIVWIEAQGDCVRLCAEGRIHRVRETLQNVENRLNPKRFHRTHRSFMVNVERIKKISAVRYGDSVLLMNDGTQVPLSRNRRDLLKAFLRPNFT